MTGQLAFAFFAGTVATANPCGFALLPAFLARQLGVDGDAGGLREGVARALAVGAVTTAGFLLVFGGVGTGISLGGRWLIQAMPWAALAIGIALVVAGVAVLVGRRVGLTLPAPVPRPGGGIASTFLFGVGYSTASLSCTLPIFLAVVGTGITGSFLGSALNFVAYAAGMGTILTALAVGAALSRGGLAAGVRRLLPYVTRLSAALLLAAGGYIVYYWAFFLLPGSATRTTGAKPIDVGTQLSMTVQTWLSGRLGQTVSVSLVGALVAVLAWILWRRVSEASSSSAETGVERHPRLGATAFEWTSREGSPVGGLPRDAGETIVPDPGEGR